MKYVNHRFLDIEVVFDFRWAVLAKYFPDAVKTIDTKKYLNRISDLEIPEIAKIDAKLWEEKYEGYRDELEDLLRYTSITPILPLLGKQYVAEGGDLISQPNAEKIELTVLLGSIKISDEAKDIFISMMRTYIPPIVEINFSNMGARNVEPLLLRNGVTELIIYDFSTWFDSKFELLQKYPIPEVVLTCPYLKASEIDIASLELPDGIVEGYRDAVEFYRELFSPVIHYNPTDLINYNFLTV